MKKIFYKLLLFLSFGLSAQDDLLNEIDNLEIDKEVSSTFKSLKIINLESTKLASKGDFYFIVAHRFDYFNNGFDDFFGLDNANTQIKFLYGISEGLTIHIARSGLQKTIDGAVKYRLIPQKNDGFPFSVVGFSSVAVNTELKKDDFPLLKFENRLSYVHQLLISRKMNERLSLQFAPTFFHENTLSDVLNADNEVILPNPQDNSQFGLGFGGRLKLTHRWSINADYVAHLNRNSQSVYKNPLAIGFDLETGGHVFQMHFTNARAMHESGFLGQTTGDWSKGEIAFGFNLVRVF
jgi:hypothetical protein